MNIALDTSALVSLLLREPTADWILGRMSAATGLLMSSATAVELGMVVEGRTSGRVTGEDLLVEWSVELVPVDRRHTVVAVGAWRRFGKGRHRAALNFGDCFSYALAQIAAVPLLCVGDDFWHTDLDVMTPGRPGK